MEAVDYARGPAKVKCLLQPGFHGGRSGCFERRLPAAFLAHHPLDGTSAQSGLGRMPKQPSSPEQRVGRLR